MIIAFFQLIKENHPVNQWLDRRAEKL